MGTIRRNHPTMLLNLVLLCAAGYAQAGLVTYSNGAVVPVDYANQAATAAHLASKFAYGYSGLHYLGKREAEADAEADAGLVGYPNGAVVPYNPYLPAMLVTTATTWASVKLMLVLLATPTVLSSPTTPTCTVMLVTTATTWASVKLMLVL